MSTHSNTILSLYNNNSHSKEKLNRGSKSSSSHYSTYNSKYIFTLDEDEVNNINKSLSNERIETQTEGISLYQFEKNHFRLVKALRSSPNCDSIWKIAQAHKDRRNFNLKLDLNFRSCFPINNLELENYLHSNREESKREKKSLVIKTESSENICNSNCNSAIPNLLFVTPKDKKSGKVLLLHSLHSSSFKKSRAEISLLSDRSKNTIRKAEEFLDCLSPENEVTNTLGNYLITDRSLDINQNIFKREKLISCSSSDFSQNKWNRESLVCKADEFLIFNGENENIKKYQSKSEKNKKETRSKKNTNFNFKGLFHYLLLNLILLLLLFFLVVYFRLNLSIKNITCICRRDLQIIDNTHNYNIQDQSRQITIYESSKELQVFNSSSRYEIIFHKNLKELRLLEKE
jgi:hypothetical protein